MPDQKMKSSLEALWTFGGVWNRFLTKRWKTFLHVFFGIKSIDTNSLLGTGLQIRTHRLQILMIFWENFIIDERDQMWGIKIDVKQAFCKISPALVGPTHAVSFGLYPLPVTVANEGL